MRQQRLAAAAVDVPAMQANSTATTTTTLTTAAAAAYGIHPQLAQPVRSEHPEPVEGFTLVVASQQQQQRWEPLLFTPQVRRPPLAPPCACEARFFSLGMKRTAATAGVHRLCDAARSLSVSVVLLGARRRPHASRSRSPKHSALCRVFC